MDEGTGKGIFADFGEVGRKNDGLDEGSFKGVRCNDGYAAWNIDFRKIGLIEKGVTANFRYTVRNGVFVVLDSLRIMGQNGLILAEQHAVFGAITCIIRVCMQGSEIITPGKRVRVDRDNAVWNKNRAYIATIRKGIALDFFDRIAAERVRNADILRQSVTVGDAGNHSAKQRAVGHRVIRPNIINVISVHIVFALFGADSEKARQQQGCDQIECGDFAKISHNVIPQMIILSDV